MMKDTSLQTYKEIYDYLPKARRNVYEAISRLSTFSSNPTAEDIVKFMGIETNSVAPRITELEKHKAITSAGKRRNSRGRLMHTWRITLEFYDYEKRESKADYYKRLLEDKTKECEKFKGLYKEYVRGFVKDLGMTDVEKTQRTLHSLFED